jgi:hypothetical protein
MRWTVFTLVAAVVLAGASGLLLYTSFEAPQLWASARELDRVGAPTEGQMHPPVLSPSAETIVDRCCNVATMDRGYNCYPIARNEILGLAREFEQRRSAGIVGLALAPLVAVGALVLGWLQRRASRRMQAEDAGG